MSETPKLWCLGSMQPGRADDSDFSSANQVDAYEMKIECLVEKGRAQGGSSDEADDGDGRPRVPSSRSCRRSVSLLPWTPKPSGAKRIPVRINLNGASPDMTKGFA